MEEYYRECKKEMLKNIAHKMGRSALGCRKRATELNYKPLPI
jgi:hypothetical protein